MQENPQIRLSEADTQSLRNLCAAYPWFSAPRIALNLRGEKCEQSFLIGRTLRSRINAEIKEVTAAEIASRSTMGLIDDFIRGGEHKIVVNEATPDDLTGMDVDWQEADDDGFATEELAEIYASQHLFDQAIEIYQKLSLQDSQKSVYFAELIRRLTAAKEVQNEEK